MSLKDTLDGIRKQAMSKADGYYEQALKVVKTGVDNYISKVEAKSCNGVMIKCSFADVSFMESTFLPYLRL